MRMGVVVLFGNKPIISIPWISGDRNLMKTPRKDVYIVIVLFVPSAVGRYSPALLH